MLKVMFALYEKDGMSREEALRYWSDTHGPIVREVPGVQRHVQHHAVGGPEGPPPFLGLATLESADADAFATAAADPASGRAVAGVANSADAARLSPFPVEDHAIVC